MGTLQSCTCPKCVACCENMPGWMSPEDATKAVTSGYASKLMLDWYAPDTRYGNINTVFVLCPASIGREGGRAADVGELFPQGWLSALSGVQTPQPCSMLQEGRCTIHDSGFKPLQCRGVMGCTGANITKREIVKLWDNPEAQTLVRQWMSIVDFSAEPVTSCAYQR